MMSRRSFLKTVLSASTVLPFKKAFAGQKAERSLKLYNIHTEENIDVTYYASWEYIPDAVEKINHLLRCHYTDKVKEIDIRLLNLLSDIREVVGRDKELTIISGYRSPEYNEYLMKVGRRVVKDSLHTQGLAIDFSIDGISAGRLSEIAKSFALGGVGKYPEFVHIDTGRIRYW